MVLPTKVELGAFAAGEVPPNLEITFKDSDENVVDLAGFDPWMRIEEELGSTSGLGGGTISIPSPASGQAIYAWERADMATPGEYTAQAWVENGVKYYASDLYTYSVYDGPGEPPA